MEAISTEYRHFLETTHYGDDELNKGLIDAYTRFIKKTGKKVAVSAFERDERRKVEAKKEPYSLKKIPTDRLHLLRHKLGGLKHKTLTEMIHRGKPLMFWLAAVDSELGRRTATA